MLPQQPFVQSLRVTSQALLLHCVYQKYNFTLYSFILQPWIHLWRIIVIANLVNIALISEAEKKKWIVSLKWFTEISNVKQKSQFAHVERKIKCFVVHGFEIEILLTRIIEKSPDNSSDFVWWSFWPVKSSEDILKQNKISRYHKLKIVTKTKRQHQDEFLGMRRELNLIQPIQCDACT